MLCGLATGLVFGFNFAWVRAEGELPVPAAVFIGVSLALTAWAAYRFLLEAGRVADSETGQLPWAWTGLTAVVVLVSAGVLFLDAFTESVIIQLHTDELEAADYWGDELEILSAGFGFDNIVGLPDDDFETTRGAGGTWLEDPSCVDDDGPLSSAVLARFINRLSRGEANTYCQASDLALRGSLVA